MKKRILSSRLRISILDRYIIKELIPIFWGAWLPNLLGLFLIYFILKDKC